MRARISELLYDAGEAESDGVEGTGNTPEDENVCVDVPVREYRFEDLAFWDLGVDLFFFLPREGFLLLAEFVGFKAAEKEGLFGGAEEGGSGGIVEHEDEGDEGDEDREQTFDYEDPTPALVVPETVHLAKANGKEASKCSSHTEERLARG